MDILERLAQWAENDMKAEAIALEAKYEIERRLKESRLYWDAFQKAADEIERLRKELTNVKICSCKQRENDINQLFEELSK